MNTKQWFEKTENITGVPTLDKKGTLFTYPNYHAVYVLADKQHTHDTFTSYVDSPKTRVDMMTEWLENTENKEIIGSIDLKSFKAAIACFRALNILENSSPVLIVFGETSGYLLTTNPLGTISERVSEDDTYMVEFSCHSQYTSQLLMFVDTIYQIIKGFSSKTFDVKIAPQKENNHYDTCLVLLQDKTRCGLYMSRSPYVDMYTWK